MYVRSAEQNNCVRSIVSQYGRTDNFLQNIRMVYSNVCVSARARLRARVFVCVYHSRYSLSLSFTNEVPQQLIRQRAL